jgi:putative membrane protein
MKKETKYRIFVALMLLGLILSGIAPHDYFTWILEVFPAIIALIILAATRKSFPMSDLAYGLILLHAWVLYIGGHYTYAEVPLFDWIKDVLHQDRNNYDKVGHFIQGFVPAIITRELLIRKQVVAKKGWLFFLSTSVCLAISAVYELIEAMVAMMTGESADAFLGTQGFVWDTQTDMLCALIGAICALALLSRRHDRSIGKLI